MLGVRPTSEDQSVSGVRETGKISEADQRRKLALVVDVATRWWGFEM